jgi:two-component system, NarL family, sensor histidine kinase UhpB
MRRHDPLSPRVRARVQGEPDVVALAATFNEMLERLESERRGSARRALMVQEGERIMGFQHHWQQIAEPSTGNVSRVDRDMRMAGLAARETSPRRVA